MRDSNQTTNGAKPIRKRVSGHFPLYLHKTGQYAKQVRGRTYYFGRDRDEALRRWLNEKDALQAGLIVREEPKPTGVMLKTACDTLLTQKQSLVSTGELSPRTLADYRSAVKRLIDHFGPHRLLIDLRPVDFIEFRKKCAENRSAVSTSNILRFVRSTLRFAYDQDMVDRPIKYGKALALPAQAVIRAERQKRGLLMFSATEIRLMLEGGRITSESGESIDVKGSTPALRAMILLAANCGFGNGDVSQLTFRSIDLKRGWHNFPRPKTAVERRCPLWPETISAIQAYLKVRPSPRNDSFADRVFLTRHGDEFVKVRHTGTGDETRITSIDAVALTFGKLLSKLNIKRPAVAFYSLRRTFRTVADEVNDQPAIDAIMGHSPHANDMAARYRQSISDERLRSVSEYVRNWLFNTTD